MRNKRWESRTPEEACGTIESNTTDLHLGAVMTTNAYKCLRLNWLSGQYEWATFNARDDADANTLVRTAAGYLPDTLSPAQVLYPAA
jgi:hypothetical protein